MKKILLAFLLLWVFSGCVEKPNEKKRVKI